MRGQELKYKFNSIKLLPLGEAPRGLGARVRAHEKFRKSLFVEGIKLPWRKREPISGRNYGCVFYESRR